MFLLSMLHNTVIKYYLLERLSSQLLNNANKKKKHLKYDIEAYKG